MVSVVSQRKSLFRYLISLLRVFPLCSAGIVETFDNNYLSIQPFSLIFILSFASLDMTKSISLPQASFGDEERFDNLVLDKFCEEIALADVRVTKRSHSKAHLECLSLVNVQELLALSLRTPKPSLGSSVTRLRSGVVDTPHTHGHQTRLLASAPQSDNAPISPGARH